jgi:dUTP pyrophosphatase
MKELLKQVNGRPVDLDIKYFADIPEIEKTEKGDWVDLRAAKDVELKAGEEAVIPLGVGMILPPGYEAWILPRSSTPRKFGIMCANSIGIIDNSYNGEQDEWGFVAVALRDTVIHKGDRICQFRLMKNMPEFNTYTVNHLNPVSRGGFGSTGTK